MGLELSDYSNSQSRVSFPAHLSQGGNVGHFIVITDLQNLATCLNEVDLFVRRFSPLSYALQICFFLFFALWVTCDN
jgi:hypothetical protein